MTGIVYLMIDTYNYFIIPMRKWSFSFICSLIVKIISSYQFSYCFLKYLRNLEIKYCIKYHLASLKNCFSCYAPQEPMTMIIFFSFLSFQHILHIVWYLFVWICIRFLFLSQSQSPTALLQLLYQIVICQIYKVSFNVYYDVVTLLRYRVAVK